MRQFKSFVASSLVFLLSFNPLFAQIPDLGGVLGGLFDRPARTKSQDPVGLGSGSSSSKEKKSGAIDGFRSGAVGEPTAAADQPWDDVTIDFGWLKQLKVLRQKKDAAKKSQTPAPPVPYDELIKGATVHAGLLTIYETLQGEDDKKKKTYFLEIKPDQLSADFIYSATLERGTGQGLISGSLLSNYIINFVRHDQEIWMIRRYTNYRAAPGSLAEEALERGYQDSSIEALADITQEHPQDGRLLVDLSELFMDDLEDVASGLKATTSPDSFGNPFDLAQKQSSFKQVQAFPLNDEIVVNLVFQVGEGVYSAQLPLPGSVEMVVRYSLSAMPPEGFVPRVADSRVGYFLENYQDLTDPTAVDPNVSFINHWRLEKVDPQADVSPVKNPIVYYLDDTIPVEYREAIKAGILGWNKAFEQFGLVGAIEVRDRPQDADWEPGDIRYNMVYWAIGDAGWVGYGPSRVNPLTGEIYHASLFLSENIIRSLGQEFDYHQLGRDQAVESSGSHGSYERCEIEKGMEREFAMNMAALEASGTLDPKERERYIQEYFSWVSAHEFGHQLGLMHNFQGSMLLTPDQLAQGNQDVLYSSVMDYPAANIGPDGQSRGKFYQSAPGPYDAWAIEYGYRPLQGTDAAAQAQELAAIAAKGDMDPKLTWSYQNGGWDPSAAVWDLGSDPLAFRRERQELAARVVERLDQSSPTKGEDYASFRSNLISAVIQNFQTVQAAGQYLGAVKYSPKHSTGDAGSPPYVPISAQQQREALSLINDYAFKDGALGLTPEVIAKVGPERVSLENPYPSNDPIPFDYVTRNLQTYALDTIFNPETLIKIGHQETMAQPGEALTMTELFETVDGYVWGELSSRKVVVSRERQSLQQIHIDQMIALMGKIDGVPVQAQSMARYELNSLSGRIGMALKTTGRVSDVSTRAHLEQAQAKISQALNAPIINLSRSF